MNIDKLPTPFVSDPFVSDDVVNECFKNLEEVWSCTEYEQLLTEAKVKADENAKKEAAENMRIRYDAVGNCLNDLEGAAGENKDWWEQWMYDVDYGNLYPAIDIEWYDRNFPWNCRLVISLCIKTFIAACADEKQQLSGMEQNFLDNCRYLSALCMEVCLNCLDNDNMQENLQNKVTPELVFSHMEALCLYIALRNEQNKLKEEAELYGIPLEKEEKPTEPKPEEKPQLSVDQLVDLPLEEKRKSEEWKDVFTEHATRIYGIAIGERKIMQGNGLGYEWTYGAPKPPSPSHLAFFLLLVYNSKDNIPWKRLQILFWPKFDKADKKGETHVGRVLRGRADQLRKRTDWYKHNINKLWGFKYTDFPPHFPTWAKEIYQYVSDIENRLEKEESAKSKKEKRK